MIAVRSNLGGSDVGRLTFLATHLYQLQTLRWLGLHLALVASPLFFFYRPWQNCVLASLLAAFTMGWFFCFTRAVRQRFGTTKLSRVQRVRLRYPSRLLAIVPLVFLLGHAYCRYVLGTHNDDFLITWWLVLWLLAPVFDRTNPIARRSAYGLALTALVSIYARFAFGTPLDDWRGSLAFSSLGAVLLALAIFDYKLLCRTARGETSGQEQPL